MKGLSLLVYTILLTFLFLSNRVAFLSLASAVNGVPAKIDQMTTQLASDLVSKPIITPPSIADVFISDCVVPRHPELDTEDVEIALRGCTNAAGVVCLFYPYYEYRYRMCHGIRYEPTETYYFPMNDSNAYSVERDDNERTLTLTRVDLS
ncbi:MAG: hypothetical protein GOV01_03785 [Candidatus Altiarchaeota archaeon]|nr:hypothetical protein [Candidatus Altiarchaeota archaeon]